MKQDAGPTESTVTSHTHQTAPTVFVEGFHYENGFTVAEFVDEEFGSVLV